MELSVVNLVSKSPSHAPLASSEGKPKEQTKLSPTREERRLKSPCEEDSEVILRNNPEDSYHKKNKLDITCMGRGWIHNFFGINSNHARCWEFENLTTDLRQKRRPSVDSVQERTFVHRKTPRQEPGRISPENPRSPNYFNNNNQPFLENSAITPTEFRKEELTINDLARLVDALQQELKKINNENMAVKWENAELKLENRRVKMFYEEICKDNDQLKKLQALDQIKYKELYAEFSKKITRLEQENKYSCTARGDNQIPRNIPLMEKKN